MRIATNNAYPHLFSLQPTRQFRIIIILQAATADVAF
jgi:hypothetical protein